MKRHVHILALFNAEVEVFAVERVRGEGHEEELNIVETSQRSMKSDTLGGCEAGTEWTNNSCSVWKNCCKGLMGPRTSSPLKGGYVGQ